MDKGPLSYSLRDKVLSYTCRADSERVLAIMPDGQIIKCRDFLDSIPVGDVNENCLYEDALATWKIRADEISECYKCELYLNVAA